MIRKSKKSGNFTTLPNQIFKEKLSIEAVGLLAYLLSLPHDWVIYKTHLHEKFDIGKDKMFRVFKELQEAKYIFTEKFQDEATGKIEYHHEVFDTPYTDFPCTGEPSTGDPCTVNPPLQKKQVTKETNTKETLNRVSESFDEFRQLFPGTKRGNETEFLNFKKKHKDWKEVLPSLTLSIKDQIRERGILANQGKFVPQWKNLQTWINGRCWEQEPQVTKEILSKNESKTIFKGVIQGPKDLPYPKVK